MLKIGDHVWELQNGKLFADWCSKIAWSGGVLF